MAGDASELHPKVNTGRHRLFRPNGDSGEADIVSVLEDPETPAAVKGDVEFARQPVEFAVVQNVVIELPGQRARIDQLLRIDAGSWAAGQIANVVGAGAARGQPQLVDRGQHLDGMRGPDLTDLEIGSGGDVEITAPEALGDRAQALCLMG